MKNHKPKSFNISPAQYTSYLHKKKVNKRNSMIVKFVAPFLGLAFVAGVIGGMYTFGKDLDAHYKKKEKIISSVRNDLYKYREGEISRMFYDTLTRSDYNMDIYFPDLDERVMFKVLPCDFGIDKGTPSEVFKKFQPGDDVLVRISNGYAVDSVTGKVSRYAGTTHLDKKFTSDPQYTYQMEEFQFKGAGSFKKETDLESKLSSFN